MSSKLAVVRVKGRVNVNNEVSKTLELLRLHRVNHCVIVDNTPSIVGMLKKAQRYITWGEINKEVLTELLRRKGQLKGRRKLTESFLKERLNINSFEELAEKLLNKELRLKDIPDFVPVFRLHPPRKGYRSIKRPFKLGGAFGYRGEKINDLLLRMM